MSAKLALQLSVLLTVLNVPLTEVASACTIVTIATTISPNITAYSTAVGPSSLLTKLRTRFTNLRILASTSELVTTRIRHGADREQDAPTDGGAPVRSRSQDRVLLTVLNVPLTLVAKLLTIVTMATTIKPSITAYSTAVGPSSLTMKRWTAFIKPFMVYSFCNVSPSCYGTVPVNLFHRLRLRHGDHPRRVA